MGENIGAGDVRYIEDEERWDPLHHPFTTLYDEDIPLLESDPGKVRSRAYDVVLNGIELGGGSIRIHQTEVQEKVFRAIALSDEEFFSGFNVQQLIGDQDIRRDPRFLQDWIFQAPREIRIGIAYQF